MSEQTSLNVEGKPGQMRKLPPRLAPEPGVESEKEEPASYPKLRVKGKPITRQVVCRLIEYFVLES